MIKRHERTGRVAEPVQVYLERGDRTILEHLAEHLSLSKSDVVRRGLAALERETFAPESHPVLRIVGMVAKESVRPETYDPAVEHDRYLAEVVDPTPRSKGRRGR